MIGIHQSQFLPWLPFFYKVFASDVFVILDDVQFQKNGVQNRNMIKTPQGTLWLTIPVRRSLETPLNAVEVADQGVFKKILKTLEMTYRQSCFFEPVFDELKMVFEKRHTHLHVLNMDLVNIILNLMKKKVDIRLSSSMGTTKKKDELVIEIIKKSGETSYLSGLGGLEYMNLDQFRDEGIEVNVCEFVYGEYPQLWTKNKGFTPELSIIDLLFNHLDQAYSYIMKHGRIKKVNQ